MGHRDMPRYFFHFSDGKRQFTDSTGIELSGLAAARAHAKGQVRQLRATFSERQIQDWSGWKLIVVNVNEKTVFEIGFDLKPISS